MATIVPVRITSASFWACTYCLAFIVNGTNGLWTTRVWCTRTLSWVAASVWISYKTSLTETHFCITAHIAICISSAWSWLTQTIRWEIWTMNTWLIWISNCIIRAITYWGPIWIASCPGSTYIWIARVNRCYTASYCVRTFHETLYTGAFGEPVW